MRRRVTVLVCLSVCLSLSLSVCPSVTTLAAALVVSMLKIRHVEVSLRLFTHGFLQKNVRSKVMAS